MVISWEEQERSIQNDILEVSIRNTRNEAITVDIQVVARGPNGKFFSRSLGKRDLGALELQKVSLPASELPIQSTGVSSPVTFTASYTTASYALIDGKLGVDKTAPSLSRKAFSPARHVTFDGDFTAANIRT
ncbi:MAG: hypothetical protein JXA30_21870 [Deltaproteobacteria bacterium]|nr:hypothetical protein [Deltaproteobacteria bacterium]